MVYSRERYLSRGRFSRQAFERDCLREYAETFPIVCGDFAFYQFPTEEFWRKLFTQRPSKFKFAFKVPEQITCKIFPAHDRYGPQAGKENPEILSARTLQEMFLKHLAPYRDRTAVLIFEFGTFNHRAFEDLPAFLDRLDPFLSALPLEFCYTVEIRNAEFLAPDYFSCLRGTPPADCLVLFQKIFVLLFQTAVSFVGCDHVEREFLDFSEELGLHVAEADAGLLDFDF